MIPEQTDGPNQPEGEPDAGHLDPGELDRQADAMKHQLRKDVASWSAARSGEGPDPIVRPGMPAAKPPTVRASRQKSKPAEPVAPVPAEKKPFRMSYDGTTDRDYIAQRIKLGAR
jgi:hypothetical protein